MMQYCKMLNGLRPGGKSELGQASGIRPDLPDLVVRSVPDKGEDALAEHVNPIPVAACILVHRDRVLLLKRTIPPCEGRWSLPSGHYEIGESAEEGMIREILEETGLSVTVRYIGSGARVLPNGVPYLSLLFWAEAPSDRITLDCENSDWAWVPMVPDKLKEFDWAFSNQLQAVLDFIDRRD